MVVPVTDLFSDLSNLYTVFHNGCTSFTLPPITVLQYLSPHILDALLLSDLYMTATLLGWGKTSLWFLFSFRRWLTILSNYSCVRWPFVLSFKNAYSYFSSFQSSSQSLIQCTSICWVLVPGRSAQVDRLLHLGPTLQELYQLGSDPWWDSLCSFPEYQSNTTCLSFPRINTHLMLPIAITRQSAGVFRTCKRSLNLSQSTCKKFIVPFRLVHSGIVLSFLNHLSHGRV